MYGKLRATFFLILLHCILISNKPVYWFQIFVCRVLSHVSIQIFGMVYLHIADDFFEALFWPRNSWGIERKVFSQLFLGLLTWFKISQKCKNINCKSYSSFFSGSVSGVKSGGSNCSVVQTQADEGHALVHRSLGNVRYIVTTILCVIYTTLLEKIAVAKS